MERIPEAELMTEADQARAYAMADFEEAHRRMIDEFERSFPSRPDSGYAVDLGCGPGDIAYRFAARYPGWRVDGVDASRAMLAQGPIVEARYPGVKSRVNLIEGLLPHCQLPRECYDVVLSNSLLHHLERPGALWAAIRRLADRGTVVMVMDLMRPESDSAVTRLVGQYAAGEPEVLRRDFANSLRAAYRMDEVRSQLDEEGITWLSVAAVTDRHMVVSGIVS